MGRKVPYSVLLSVPLPAPYFTEIIIQCRLLNFQVVPHTDWESCTVFHDAAVVFKIKDVISIYSDPLVDEDEAGILPRQFYEFRHGHTAAQFFPVCKYNVQVMGIRNDGGDAVKE